MLNFHFVDIDMVRAFVDAHLSFRFCLTDDEKSEDTIHLRLVTTDPYFDLTFYPYIYEDFVPLNTNWFIEMYLNQDFGFYHRLGYKGGIHIRVWNLKDDTLIFDKTIWMFKKYLPIRLNTHSVPHECPRIWCIGDSHIWHNFGGINNVSILKYQLIKYSMPSLTMHRFSSRNWKDFLEFLPIEPQDILLFNFGECDLRYNFKLYSEKSGVNVKSVIYDSCQKYFAVLKQIEKIYADNKIYLMTPNFPISNDLEKETDYFAPYTGDEIIRKEMDDFFRCLIKTQPFFKVYDCPQQYADVNGYMNKENLNPKDIHISNFQYFLDGLLIFLKANGHT